MTRCLVTGAAGYIGSRLVAALSATGEQVTATARDLDRLRDFDFPRTVTRLPLDVSDEDSCRSALGAGPVDVAYYLVHSLGEQDFVRQDLTDASRFAAAAERAGVRRIVYLGGFVPDEPLSDHLASRADVGQALGATSVELVWLRAAVVLGAGSTSFELIRHLANRLRVVPLPPDMGRPVSPIAVDDVLHYLRAAADPAVLPAGCYDIANGEQPTYAELVQAYAASRELRRVWLPVPRLPAALTARLSSWLTPVPQELAKDLLVSVPNTMHSDDDRIRAVVLDPEDGLTSVAEAMRRSIQRDGFTGVCATTDPLQLTTTDPVWAGRQ